MQFQQSLHTHWAQNGRISTIRFHNLKYLEGNCMRNVSPADERRPQGLRAHIHTLTMKAFSDSSAKKVRPLRPIPQQFRKKTRPAHPHQHQTRYKTRPAHPHQRHTRYKTRPAHPLSPHVRDKTRPAHPLSPHVRDKTRPAHPRQQHLRYKTRPAHSKWPNVARFARAWRTFYRCHHQQATQGELFHARTHTRPSRRIPLASSAAVEARHTATDLYTPIMAAPLISKEDQQTAANLCTHDPPIVVDTGDHRQNRNERKNAHT